MTRRILIALITIPFLGATYAQSSITQTDSAYTSSIDQHYTRSNLIRIKWTRQLPYAVRNSLNKSQYTSWYVEKIIRYKTKENTIYRFYLSNGNLLDGDHHDSFLKTDSLEITDNGTILRN